MSETLAVTGTLYQKMDTQKLTEKFDKREFIIETSDTQYPQLVKFELVNERCSLVDKFNKGDKIKISFNLRGREWKKDEKNSVFFTALQAWRVEHLGEGSSANAQGSTEKQPQSVAEPAANESKGVYDEDLPF